MTLIIQVRERDDRPCLYECWHDGLYLVGNTPDPFVDSCRVLLAWGYDRHHRVVMRHYGSDVDALRGRLGVVAASPIAPSDQGATSPPAGLENELTKAAA